MQNRLLTTENLSIIEASAEDLTLSSNDSSVTGVVLGDGKVVKTNQVILTTGTFLRGKILYYF